MTVLMTAATDQEEVEEMGVEDQLVLVVEVVGGLRGGDLGVVEGDVRPILSTILSPPTPRPTTLDQSTPRLTLTIYSGAGNSEIFVLSIKYFI